jgi:hypothetical protein
MQSSGGQHLLGFRIEDLELKVVDLLLDLLVATLLPLHPQEQAEHGQMQHPDSSLQSNQLDVTIAIRHLLSSVQHNQVTPCDVATQPYLN